MRPLLPLACALLAGCVPPPFPEDRLPPWEDRPLRASFTASYDAVWEAAVQVVSARYPVARVDRARGFLSTEWVVGPSDSLYADYGGTRIPEKVRFRLRVDVAPRGDRVEVCLAGREQVEKDVISADLAFTGSVYEWLDVPSSTRRERLLLQAMLDVLEAPPSTIWRDG